METNNLDPESPPASPGLVLETEVPATNANIDHFALDGFSATEKVPQKPKKRSQTRRRLQMTLEGELEGTTGFPRDTMAIIEDGDDDVPLNLNVSSDSYFSHHRDSLSDTFGTPQPSIKNRRRRASDISDTGSIRSLKSGYSDGSEGDFDSNNLNLTPSSSRRSSSHKGNRRSVFGSNAMMSLEEESDYGNNGNSRSSSKSGSRPSSRSGSRTRSRSITNRLIRDGKDYMQPTQIFKSLFIMEQSLCQQYIQQTNLRYRYLLFLTMMIGGISVGIWGSFFMAVGEGYSRDYIYDYVKLFCRFGSFILAITLMLFYFSGMYHRTISRPRQYLSSTNRGLRQFNIKLVKIRTSIYERIIKVLKTVYFWGITALKLVIVFLHKWFHLVPILWVQSITRYEITIKYERTRDAIREVKIMLNPRAFNGSTRDQWEVYRRQQGLLERTRRPQRVTQR